MISRCALCIFFLFTVGATFASDIRWVGQANGEWQVDSNWTTTGEIPVVQRVPEDGDTVVIDNTTFQQIVLLTGHTAPIDSLLVSSRMRLVTNGFLLTVDQDDESLTRIEGTDSVLQAEPRSDDPSLPAVSVDSLTINSGGTLRLLGGVVEVDELAVVGPGGVLSGYGVIDFNNVAGTPGTVVLDNRGQIRIDVFQTVQLNAPGGGTIHLGGSTNAGMVEVFNTGTLRVTAPLSDVFNSTAIVRPQARLAIDEPWQLGPNGKLELEGGQTDAFAAKLEGGIVNVHGVLEVDGVGHLDAPAILMPQAMVNYTSTGFNALRVRENITIHPGATFMGEGRLTIADDSVLTVADDLNLATRLELTDDGLLQFGSEATRLDVHSYSQSNDARLNLHVSGTGLDAHDRLVVSGNVSLGGTLAVEFAPEFTPEVANILAVFSTLGEIDDGDRYDEIIVPTLPAGLTWGVDYAPNFVRLRITESTVAGDYNNDGIVNAADYVVWRNNVGRTFPLTNEDPSITPGMVTPEDFDVWVANFGTTTAGRSSSAAVPEPAGALLLLLVATTLAPWSGRVRIRC